MKTNKELINYFEEGLSKGHSIEVLKKELIKGGYSISSVNSAALKFRKNIPTSMKVLSTYYYIKSVFFSLFIIIPILTILEIDLGFLDMGLFLFDILFYGAMGGIVGLLTLGILIISLVILMFFIGRGIRRGKNKWRVWGIVMSSLSLVFSLYSILDSVRASITSILLLSIPIPKICGIKVSDYLDLAEGRAKRKIPRTREEWSNRLDLCLECYERDI